MPRNRNTERPHRDAFHKRFKFFYGDIVQRVWDARELHQIAKNRERRKIYRIRIKTIQEMW